jgi:hypothetical protein
VYQKALVAREKLEEPNSPAIAEVYDSIACSYCKIGDVLQALEYLAKADSIKFAHFNQTSAHTQAIIHWLTFKKISQKKHLNPYVSAGNFRTRHTRKLLSPNTQSMLATLFYWHRYSMHSDTKRRANDWLRYQSLSAEEYLALGDLVWLTQYSLLQECWKLRTNKSWLQECMESSLR